jgi:D-alanyl-D-alanine carboxypeptidase
MLLRVVDKQRGLPSDYVPPSLTRVDDRWTVPSFEGQTLQTEAAGALIELLTAARAVGHDLRLRSGFRSYADQIETYQYWVARLGEQQARRESAPAGHSEHQLGTTADLSSAAVHWELIEAFGATPEARWLADHAHEFGFALSYPQDSEAVTGYVWEPWHLRYLGRDCAAARQASRAVLMRFLESLEGRAP